MSDILFFFFFNDTATTEIYTLSLHDALPILHLFGGTSSSLRRGRAWGHCRRVSLRRGGAHRDRKSTRLNSSHLVISYAVFCLKKKNNIQCPSRPYVRIIAYVPIARASGSCEY